MYGSRSCPKYHVDTQPLYPNQVTRTVVLIKTVIENSPAHMSTPLAISVPDYWSTPPLKYTSSGVLKIDSQYSLSVDMSYTFNRKLSKNKNRSKVIKYLVY